MRYMILSIGLVLAMSGCGSRPEVEPVTPLVSPSGAPVVASRMAQSLAEAVALNFVSSVMAKGSQVAITLNSTVFDGVRWRTEFTVDGKPAVLMIIAGEGRGVESIDCPNGTTVTYDVFQSAGGNGTLCW